ncbi:MAG: hypothetical protein K2M75_01735 [Clostridia bacterium]|nr:hypothetical protein [Clostridia bacterium]
MKYSFKFLFGTISLSLISMVLFFTSWSIGRAITGSWDIGKWNNDKSYRIVSEDTCELNEINVIKDINLTLKED